MTDSSSNRAGEGRAAGGLDAQAIAFRAVQEAILPASCSTCGQAEIRAAFRPAGTLGGDLYETIPLGEGRDAYLIGDVTGHGPSAALVMAVLYGAVRALLRRGVPPCTVISELDAILDDLGRRGGGVCVFSATLFVGMIEPDGTLRCASAGHPPPIVLRRDGSSEILTGGAQPLGFALLARCGEADARLRPGDRLLLYTDGVLGAATPADLASRAATIAGPPDRVVEALVAAGEDDDRTAVKSRKKDLTPYLGTNDRLYV